MHAKGQPFDPSSKMFLSIGEFEPTASDVAALGVIVNPPAGDLSPSNIVEADATGTASITLTTWVQAQAPSPAISFLDNSVMTSPRTATVRHFIHNLQSGGGPTVVTASDLTSEPAPAGDVAAPAGSVDRWYKAQSPAVLLAPGVYRILTVLRGFGQAADDVAAFHDDTYVEVMQHSPI